MTHQVRAVVARGKGAPVSLETIIVPDPGPGEAVVKVQACGVCHTDLHYREGGINDDFPFLLGHEAAGVVEAVGEGVTDVAPGDFVILNWRAVCGQCRACLRGRPWYCFDTHNATQKMTLADGTELSPALGIGAFAEKTLVAAGQCTKVDPAAVPGRRRAARLRRDGRASAPPSTPATSAAATSVAVIGCGGVGDAAIAGRPAGRRGEDHRRRHRRPQAGDRRSELGATHTVNSTEHRPGRGDPRADRRLRRRRRHRGGRPPGDVQAGLLRPRPGRHGRPGRRAHPGDEAGTAAAGRLRPRRRAEVLLVRRLPALPRLPDADRPATCRAGWTWTRSSPRPSRSTRSRRPSSGCTRGDVLRSVVVL